MCVFVCLGVQQTQSRDHRARKSRYRVRACAHTIIVKELIPYIYGALDCGRTLYMGVILLMLFLCNHIRLADTHTHIFFGAMRVCAISAISAASV